MKFFKITANSTFIDTYIVSAENFDQVRDLFYHQKFNPIKSELLTEQIASIFEISKEEIGQFFIPDFLEIPTFDEEKGISLFNLRLTPLQD